MTDEPYQLTARDFLEMTPWGHQSVEETLQVRDLSEVERLRRDSSFYETMRFKALRKLESDARTVHRVRDIIIHILGFTNLMTVICLIESLNG